MTPARFGRACALMLLSFLGCHHYVPVEPGAATRGDRVRVHPAAPSDSLGESEEVGSFSGQVVGSDGTTLLVATPSAPGSAFRDTLRLSRSAIARLEEERFAVWESAAVVGAVVGAAVLAIELDVTGGSRVGGPAGGGGVEAVRGWP